MNIYRNKKTGEFKKLDEKKEGWELYEDQQWGSTYMSLQQKNIEKIKSECNRRIRTIDGQEMSKEEWILKSQNYQDIKHQYLVNSIITGNQGKVPEDLVVSDEDFEFARRVLYRKDLLKNKLYKKNKSDMLKLNPLKLKDYDCTSPSLWEIEEKFKL